MRAIDAWVASPPSDIIAATLTRAGRDVCEHGRSPCYLRCGVEIVARDGRGAPTWAPIRAADRAAWFEKLKENSKRGAARS